METSGSERQGHALGHGHAASSARQIRCVDDFPASAVNDATGTVSRIRHDTLDVLVADVRAQACRVAECALPRCMSGVRTRRRRLVGKWRSALSRKISWEPSIRCQRIAPSTGLPALRGARPRGPVSPCSVLRAHLEPSARGFRASQPTSRARRSAGSVHAWERLGSALQVILARLFGLAVPRYVDDLF